jgi:hypothetical protein
MKVYKNFIILLLVLISISCEQQKEIKEDKYQIST